MEQARAETSVRREGLPDPQKLAACGIQTRESIDWQASLHPKSPAPEMQVPEPQIRQAALDAALDQHRARINQLREKFRERPEEARRDFSTARDYRGSEQER